MTSEHYDEDFDEEFEDDFEPEEERTCSKRVDVASIRV